MATRANKPKTVKTVKPVVKTAAAPAQSSSQAKNLQQELGKKNPFELLEEETYLNLLRTADALSGQLRVLMLAHDLSEPMYNALRIVAARGQQGIPSQSIARDMVCRSPDMTSLVDRLCKQGLVKRERSTEDRRVVIVKVTEQGSSVLAKLKKPSQNLLRQMLAHMTPAKLASLNELLFTARQSNPATSPASSS